MQKVQNCTCRTGRNFYDAVHKTIRTIKTACFYFFYSPISLHLGLTENSKSVSWLQVIMLSPRNSLSPEQLTVTAVLKLTGKDSSVVRLEISGGRPVQSSDFFDYQC